MFDRLQNKQHKSPQSIHNSRRQW